MRVELSREAYRAVKRGEKRFLRLGADSAAKKGDAVEILEIGAPVALPIYAIVTYAEQTDWVLFISIEKC
jgi:hypothetical protein